MAFLNNFGKKASEATAKAVQKAQEFSEATRINSLISDEEKKINNIYYQIGKLYVSLHGADAEEEFIGMVGDIAEAERKISDYRKQIQELKGVQRCEKCGAEVAKDAAFCSSCGTPMPKAEETVIEDDCVKCESCGASVKRGMRFCTSCGKPLMNTSVIQSVSDGEVEEVKSEIIEKTCSGCGAKITEDIAFCTECGTKL